MFACLFVVGIDRIEERLHCRRAETLRSRTGSVLVVEEAAGGNAD
jgi:hypothetical protein